MENEDWIAVSDNPKYEVSSWGNVRVAKSRKEINLNYDRYGYVFVHIGGKKRSVHRLMMASFVGESEQIVRHLDDVKDNNVLSNLSYGNHSENAMDVVLRGEHHYARREECSRGHEYTDSSTGYKVSPNGRRARVCRKCREQKRREVGIPPRFYQSCPYGHSLPEKLKGRRICGECNKLRQRARSAGLTYPEYMSSIGVNRAERGGAK